MAGETILIVDDKSSFRFLVQGYLKDAGYATVCAGGAVEALELLDRMAIDLMLSDLIMPDMDGVALLAEVQRRFPHLPFVVITAHGSVESAVTAMKQGADDYLLKPLHREELLLTIGRSLEGAHLRQRCDQMEGLLNERFSFEHIKTVSPVMASVLKAARQVAAFAGTTVALYGESGVGKEVLARAIHSASGCSPAAFVPVNCAAIPETLLESELFGHVKGAFTGADSSREGKCRRARGGTLFLDEIGDMPLPLQAKLLRMLEEKVYECLGSDETQPADFRVIVATHRNLKQLSQEGQFRTDLFYRLNVFPLTIPPLRDRREDIPHLAEHFLEIFRRHQGKALPGLSRAAMDVIMAHDWPGNVRELRNRLEYAAIMTSGELIQPEHLRLHGPAGTNCGAPSSLLTLHFEFTPETFSLNEVVNRLKAWALAQTGNNKSAAARLLKTTRKLFY
ncbi:putative two component, sigma54 specific, transcriptional regulator, Fis family [Desulfobulbus propionicus DSM 2032]|uniref:Two component, sigma54 specific, transcriptional regulator, Fis family n=1 Tax=Desulfobulbus propionicus (strain ATCC 33891 / DSM 2032 / VKM B-1956 / 1pr3) TaxID=577650 RepID=A0A7U3YLH3_DESPD|nr:sigma-54 dependent transcriptional regulator [Desulfobulbus propionicus]ADW17575.1 putative two component, sigma54 specific, transcriptional regulator, Fis family [Desulfobulbus propionicus DSM 2032]